MTQTTLTDQLAAAKAVLRSLQLEPVEQARQLVSGHRNSIPLLAAGADGKRYLLKFYLPAPPQQLLPVGSRHDDYARREVGTYRLLDVVDPKRRELPAPRTVLYGPGDPTGWLLLEWLPFAPGPAEETLGMDHVLALLDKLAKFPADRLLGRRGFPLEHWDPIGYLDRIRGMYDAVFCVVGEARWRQVHRFFAEAVRWTDGRKPILVHGDFLQENIVVNEDGEPYLVDYENVGIGSPDHDLAWFWIHSTRHQNWKRELMQRWLGSRIGGDRIRAEWGIRSALVYLALRRLRWSFLTHGDDDPQKGHNLALLDAALEGGRELFPV